MGGLRTDMALAPVLLLLAGIGVLVANAATVQVPPALEYDDHDFVVRDASGETVVDLGVTHPKTVPSENCKDANTHGCRRWGNGRKLTITHDGGEDLCMTVQWTLSAPDTAMDCFPLGDANWYGGGEEIPQKWPLEKHENLSHSMVTQETGNRGVQDPFWFNSKGLSIYVDPGVPLFMSINADTPNALCLEAKIEAPYRKRPAGFLLKYHLCKYSDPKEAFMNAVQKHLGKPTGYPDERMIRDPLWSTWAQYKTNISDVIVREFAKDIKDNNFTNSQLEIDDRWETCYGSKMFDKTRFPDAKKLVSDLKADGFRVTIWTHPFIQLDCTDTLNEANGKGILVKDETGSIQTKWWNGNASIIDFTKKEAQDWFFQKHKQVLEDTGLDGFKFDAGETSWYPQLPDFTHTIPAAVDEQYPSLVTKMYVETCARFGGISEVRSAYLSQSLPVFVRMVDKDSRWGDNNGLKSLVTTLLQMNMVGYSMILPDMIGGNEYNFEVATQELFIRWLQANTFMPALQYAVVPWQFLEKQHDTVKIARRFNDLHAQYTDKIIAAMKKNVADGTPVNPPIWWIDPQDKDALKEDSEYLLGEDILVAPVLEQNAVKRDIYLPKGMWKDQNTGTVYEGPKLIKDYSAPLEILPWFMKVEPTPSTTSTTSAPSSTASPSSASSVSLNVLIYMSLIVLGLVFVRQ